MYEVVKLTSEFKLSQKQQETFSALAHDLKTLKDNVSLLQDIVVRAGFVLDTLLNVEPHDIDTLYTTKEQVGHLFEKCRCDDIRVIIPNLKFEIFNKEHELDLGHFGEGEVYVPLIEKTVGYHSHLIDVGDMVCIDSNGDIWGNKEAEYCIKNRIHEIRYDGWILFSYFIREFPYTDYYYFCTLNIFRGLKMISSKNYGGAGPNFLTLLENAKPILDYTSTVPKYIEALNKYRNKKAPFMDVTEITKTLEVTKVSNANYIVDMLVKVFSL